MNLSYKELANRIKEHDRIVILPHLHLDGDALGSSTALCMALRQIGKRAVVVTGERTQKALDFLEYDCVVEKLEDFRDGSGEPFGDIGLSIMVDCSTRNRIAGREELFFSAPFKACIDHHAVVNEDLHFDFHRIEPDSAATGEIVYYLINELGAGIDLRMANAIYSAITTDTGNFCYSNTTARSHRIVESFFVLTDFDPKAVTALIYERMSFSTLRLEGEMLGTISLYYDGKLGIARITQEMLEKTGAKMEDTDGFVNKVLGIDGVEVACLMKVNEEGVVRVSLRSKSKVNVAMVAKSHGGGGHVNASGCDIYEEPDTAEQLLIDDFADVFRKRTVIAGTEITE